MADTLALQHTAQLVDRAGRLAFHSKRQHLTPADVMAAAGEQGYGGASLPQLLQVADADLLFRYEAELDTAEVARNGQLPAVPLEVGVAQHWLAVDGVQPATAENVQPRRAAAQPARAAAARPTAVAPGGTGQPVPGAPAADGGAPGAGQAADVPGGVAAGLPLKHSLSEELQLYYSVVRRALQRPAPGAAPGAALGARAVMASLSTDPGLQPVLPYLMPLLADEVSKSLDDVQQLRLILGAMHAVLKNPHLQLVPYIHHLLPAILTCLVARNLGSDANHWVLRDEAASLLTQIALLSEKRRDELALALARVQKTLAGVLFDTAPETQYGSLVGLAAFGVPVLLHVVVPSLPRYAELFQTAQQQMQGPSPASLQVRSALVAALGRCVAWQKGSQAAHVLQATADAGLDIEPVAPVSEVHL